MSETPPVYRWSGAAMLRASTYPPDLELPAVPDLSGEDAVDRSRQWLASVWDLPQVRDAVLLASPALGAEIQRAIHGGGSPKRIRRLALSLFAYLARWQRRATPFGAFAGITGIEVGSGPSVAWGQHHTAVLRADGAWLASVIATLESEPRLLERLPLMANNTLMARGSRLVAPGVPAGGDTILMPPVEVSARATTPVLLALELAAAPMPYEQVRAGLAAEYPSVPVTKFDALLAGLVAQDFLISALWPPITCTDALDHVCTVLAQTRTDDLEEISDFAAELDKIRAELSRPDAQAGPLADRMRSLQHADAVPVMLDTRLDAQARLPEAVVREAEGAAAALVRLSPYPYGQARWRDYFARFRAKYGVGAVVPVLELVADSGLGMPADFLGSYRRSAPRPSTDRDHLLLEMIEAAVLDGSREIVLTDKTIEELADWQDDPVPPGRIEMAFEVHAPTLHALGHGRFELAATGAPRPASSMAGRFAHLLTEGERRPWADSLTASGNATAAQLSFAPRRRRDDVLVRVPRLLPDVINLGDHQPQGAGVLGPSDLGITIDTRQFHLVELSTGRTIEPRVAHALEAGKHTPPLARFIAELATARCQAYGMFDFGAAARLPYLPGVRYRRTLLAQPRWLLPPSALPGATAPDHAWDEALNDWQARWRMPDQVAAVEGDQRLPLDLSQAVDRQLLRSRLARSTGPIELRGTPGAKANGWIGRPHEILFAFHHRPSAATPTRGASPRHTAVGAPVDFPMDGDVLHARLLGHPDRWDEILINHVPALLVGIGSATQWWFQRFKDTARPDADQFLDLFWRVPPTQHGDVLREIGTWAAGLRTERLVAQLHVSGYQPQPGRYGHGQALDAAHAVFAADSAAAVAQIRAALAAEVPTQALAAASMVNIAASLAAHPAQGLGWLCTVLPRRTGPTDAELRRTTEKFTSPGAPAPALLDLPGGDLITMAWQQRATALAAYRDHLGQQDRDPSTVLRSLLHGHHLRAVAADPVREEATDRLARSCALSLTSRRPR